MTSCSFSVRLLYLGRIRPGSSIRVERRKGTFRGVLDDILGMGSQVRIVVILFCMWL